MAIFAAVQTPEKVKDTVKEVVRKPYPKYKVIVLNVSIPLSMFLNA